MTKTLSSLIVNCSLNSRISEDLSAELRKFSEIKLVNFGDIDEQFQIGKKINAFVISGSAARIVQSSDRAKFEGV